VFAFDDEIVANFSDRKSVSAYPMDTELVRPSKPRNVRGTLSSDGDSFTITWDAPTTSVDGSTIPASELDFYKIIRLRSMRRATDQITTQSADSGTSFTDSPVMGQKFFYKIRAVNVVNQESPDSNLVRIPDQSGGKSTDVYVVLEDDPLTVVRVPIEAVTGLEEINAELSGERKEEEEGGEVFKSIEINHTLVLLNSNTTMYSDVF